MYETEFIKSQDRNGPVSKTRKHQEMKLKTERALWANFYLVDYWILTLKNYLKIIRKILGISAVTMQ